MNLKKRLKKFFTLNRSADDGFTLVELIVVIAILGILAGVGTVAYSGYIKKAQTAADEILLDSLNTAFAVACIENGVDATDSAVSANNITIGADKKVPADGLVVSHAKADDIEEAFWNYYESGEFKVYTELTYANGMFKGVADGVELDYNGHKIVVSQAAINSLKNSTFGTELGGEALMGEIAKLTELIGSGDIDLTTLLKDEAYMRSLASYLGIENADTLSFDPDNGGELNTAIDAAMEAAGATDGTPLLNGLVYYAAEGTKNMTSDAVTTFLTSGNITGNLSSDQATKLAQASMAYGMYTAFVNNSKYNTVGATSSSENPMAALQTISGSGDYSAAFQKYITSPEGTADIEAYMAAMDVINNSTGNEATASVLVNGFDDPELVALLTQVLGK